MTNLRQKFLRSKNGQTLTPNSQPRICEQCQLLNLNDTLGINLHGGSLALIDGEGQPIISDNMEAQTWLPNHEDILSPLSDDVGLPTVPPTFPFRTEHDDQVVLGIWDSNRSKHRAKPSCSLCALFWSSKVTEGKSFYVVATLRDLDATAWAKQPYAFSQSWWTLVLDESCLGNSRSNFLLEHQSLLCTLRLGNSDVLGFRSAPSTANANLALARFWLENCQQTHEECSAPMLNVPGMRVIDCLTMKVVEAPPFCRYAALSYRWGPETGQPNILSMVQTFPRTISDATIVSLKLGLQYLWVDRYCIDQEDSVNKAQQISNMHLIYRLAEITIIASAGLGPDHGLPGVGDTARIFSPQVVLDDVKVFRGLSNDIDPDSEWQTRGWTLQEACLSRRRITFTDSRFVCECAHSISRESIRSEIQKRTPGRLFGEIHSCDFLYQSRDARSNLETFINLAMEYNKRDLTHDSDAMNAFMGITQAFSLLENPVYSMWGLPFIHQADLHPLTAVSEAKSTFLRSFCWEDMLSGRQRSCTRRQDFPSWSWVGWRTDIRYASQRPDKSELLGKIEVEPEYEYGGRLAFDEVCSSVPHEPAAYMYPKAVHIRAYILPPGCLLRIEDRPALDQELCLLTSRWQLETGHGVELMLPACSASGEEIEKNIRKAYWQIAMLCSGYWLLSGIVIQGRANEQFCQRIGHVRITHPRGSTSLTTLFDDVVRSTQSQPRWVSMT